MAVGAASNARKSGKHFCLAPARALEKSEDRLEGERAAQGQKEGLQPGVYVGELDRRNYELVPRPDAGC
jgi:hypothetical protein